MKAFALATLALTLLDSDAAVAKSWISLNMTAPSVMTDTTSYFFSNVPVMFGTPPQEVEMTVNLYSSLLAAFSYDCNLCAGGSPFDYSRSSTFGSSDRKWAASSSELSGNYFQETIGFADDIKLEKSDFVAISDMSHSAKPRVQNGNLGLFVDDSERSNSYIYQLWENDKLIDPVVGLRFNPSNPRLTLGSLDPADYAGEINWIQLETPQDSYNLANVFKIDGFKGHNGSFFPFGSSDTLAGINSLFNNIAVPNNWPYLVDPNFLGPGTIIRDPLRTDFAYQCNDTEPYVPLTVVINGVDYQIDSKDNLVHVPSLNPDYCNVGFQNATAGIEPGITLGLTFLRSVYLAYRFPTDSCPGYYGFAFPSGANRTEAQKSQKPTATPSMSSQCLSFSKPTSTPTFSPPPSRNPELSQTTYGVYMRPNDQQVPLIGIDDLPQGTWSQSTTI